MKHYNTVILFVLLLQYTVVCCAIHKQTTTTGEVIKKITEIREMGDKKEVKSVKYLIRVFETSTSDAIRLEAAKSLGRIGDKRAIPVLKKATFEEKNQIIQSAAEEALILIKQNESK